MYSGFLPAYGSLASQYTQQFVINAGNMVRGDNPAYDKDDFLDYFPQFTGLVSDNIIDLYIAMANDTVLQARWHAQWLFGMHNFIAHFITLYLQQIGGGAGSTAGQVIGAGRIQGLNTSKSVGDLSVSQDYSVLISGMENWPGWTSTDFGFRFATMAKNFGKGGAYIW